MGFRLDRAVAGDDGKCQIKLAFGIDAGRQAIEIEAELGATGGCRFHRLRIAALRIGRRTHHQQLVAHGLFGVVCDAADRGEPADRLELVARDFNRRCVCRTSFGRRHDDDQLKREVAKAKALAASCDNDPAVARSNTSLRGSSAWAAIASRFDGPSHPPGRRRAARTS